MIIGVNTRFLLTSKMEGFGWFTYETMKRITRNHPEHTFIFFFDRPFDKKFIFSENIIPVVVPPPTRHPKLILFWFDYSIPYYLKKYKCEAFISPDGFLSKRTKLPQLAVMHDLNFEHNPGDFPKNILKLYKDNFPKYAKIAARICTVSAYSKNDICTTYRIDENKVDIAYNGVSDFFKPLEETQKIAVRQKYTVGKPYILFVGALHKRKNLHRLFEAFELVKRKKLSEHQLLIVGENLFSSQKIKPSNEIINEVKFTGHVDLMDLAKITAAADLMAFVSYFEGFGIPLVEAMKSGTPVLAGNKTSLPEIGGDAVYYCDPLSVQDIAAKLEVLISNPELRMELSAKGILQATKYSWDNTASQLWSSFEKII